MKLSCCCMKTPIWGALPLELVLVNQVCVLKNGPMFQLTKGHETVFQNFRKTFLLPRCALKFSGLLKMAKIELADSGVAALEGQEKRGSGVFSQQVMGA